MLVDDNESDEVLELLQKCSEELLDETINCATDGGEGSANNNGNKPQSVVGTSSQELEPVKNLMRFDHIYHKQDCVDSPLKEIVDNNNNNNTTITEKTVYNINGNVNDVTATAHSVLAFASIPKPLSPLSSCHSDCGYESASSPLSSLGENCDDGNCNDGKMEWEQSITELFPDLV